MFNVISNAIQKARFLFAKAICVYQYQTATAYKDNHKNQEISPLPPDPICNS